MYQMNNFCCLIFAVLVENAVIATMKNLREIKLGKINQ